MESYEPEAKSGFALLGRREGEVLEVLAFDVEDGKVLCLFETQEIAAAFAKLSPEVRGQGWSVHVMTTDRLPDLVEKFDYVTVDPSPQLGAGKELLTALGFARSLRRDNIPGSE
ncbi:MAG: hypothetical protein WA990_13960 [Rubrobacteraceae bacterium]